MVAIIVGCGSDIAKEIIKRLEEDGWETRLYHHDEVPRKERWDFLMIASGVMGVSLKDSILDNAVVPIYTALELLPYSNSGASVCFFAGPNPNRPFPRDPWYSLSKVLLIKACEELNGLVKFFAFGPGYVRTKLQPNLDKQMSSHDEIYTKLKLCMENEWSGGRNIHIRDDLSKVSEWSKDHLKLRRCEDS